VHDHLHAPIDQPPHWFGQRAIGVVILGGEFDEPELGVALDRASQLRPPADPEAQVAEPAAHSADRGRK